MSLWCVDFEPLLGGECEFVWNDLKTGKVSIYGKYSEYKTSNLRTTDLHLEIRLKIVLFPPKSGHLFNYRCVYLGPRLGWDCSYVCQVLRI